MGRPRTQTQQYTLHLPQPHAGQKQVLREAKRWNAVCCGRRFGKSTLGIDRFIEPALHGKPSAWFSPTYKMLADTWREVRRVVHPVIQTPNVQERRLELVGGGILDFWSLDIADSARGRKYARVVIDEAAMVADLGEAWQSVIRPTLTDFQGDAWFLSTPRGRNFFWQLWQRGQDPNAPEWMSWQMPTSANPYIAPEEIEDARANLPEQNFAQEYLAHFLEDSGGVFRRIWEAATMKDFPPVDSSRQTVMGVDWARSNDFTVLTVLDVRTKEVVAIDRFNQIDWPLQRGRLKSLFDKWKPSAILAEENSIGAVNIAELHREGLPIRGFVTTNSTKANIIEHLALWIENGVISYPQDHELLGELAAYELERTPSGLMRYTAPTGMHDDMVISLALAAWAAEQGDRTHKLANLMGAIPMIVQAGRKALPAPRPFAEVR